MAENQIITLEDLKEFLNEKYESEFKSLSAEGVIENCNLILKDYDLSADEYEYVMPLKSAMEEQTVQKTMINTIKAKQILLKKKK